MIVFALAADDGEMITEARIVPVATALTNFDQVLTELLLAAHALASHVLGECDHFRMFMREFVYFQT